MRPLTRPATAIRGLAGTALAPGDAGYDEARALHNAAIDRRPALIARCAGPHDVVVALRYARRRGLDVTVRGGGHAVGGFALADDAVAIDVSPMRAVSVDPARRIARRAGRRHLARARRRDPGARARGHRRADAVGRRGRASRSAPARAGWSASWGLRRTRCARRASSPRPATSSPRAPRSTRTCSGRCAAAVPGSASSSSSSWRSRRSARRCSAACSRGRSAVPATWPRRTRT